MERVIRVFDDFAAADEADRWEYASLTPEQRLEILLDLVARYRESFGEAGEGFERVFRVVELSQR